MCARLLAADCLSYAAVKRALERRQAKATSAPPSLSSAGPQVRPITHYQSFWEAHAKTHHDGDPDEHVYH